MKNKKWFTLIEIMVVIVIIAILLTLTMWISSDRIQILKMKSVQEQLIYNYNNLFSKNMLTNYYEWSMYENMIIKMIKDDKQFTYGYKRFNENEESINYKHDYVEWWNYKFTELLLDWHITDNITIKLTPYILWCEISNWNTTWNKLISKVTINNNKKYCFQISSNLCKQENIDCDYIN